MDPVVRSRFQGHQKYLASILKLSKPIEGETLYLYLAVSRTASCQRCTHSSRKWQGATSILFGKRIRSRWDTIFCTGKASLNFGRRCQATQTILSVSLNSRINKLYFEVSLPATRVPWSTFKLGYQTQRIWYFIRTSNGHKRPSSRWFHRKIYRFGRPCWCLSRIEDCNSIAPIETTVPQEAA